MVVERLDNRLAGGGQGRTARTKDPGDRPSVSGCGLKGKEVIHTTVSAMRAWAAAEAASVWT